MTSEQDLINHYFKAIGAFFAPFLMPKYLKNNVSDLLRHNWSHIRLHVLATSKNSLTVAVK